MIDSYFCNCHDCNRSYRNMLKHMEQGDPKLLNFKNYLKFHYRLCDSECSYNKLYMYLKEKYPNGYGITQLVTIPNKYRQIICYYHWNRNEVFDD